MNFNSEKKNDYLNKTTCFIGGVLLVKLLLMGLFSSDYQNVLFMRFVNGFLDSLSSGELVNPYSLFESESNLFPYPPGMLLVECLGGVASRLTDSLFLSNLLFKLPILLFDCLASYFLYRMYPGRKIWTMGLYFVSPVILYACYMHGQLDIIPTSLLIGASYYLTKRSTYRNLLFVVLTSAAILCKFHIVAILPIFFVYIMKKYGWRKATAQIGAIVGLTALGVAPFFCNGFVHNVLFNQEQSILTQIVINYNSVVIYLPILALLLVYLLASTTIKINKELLFSYSGLLYSIFLCLIPPMPGWYVWIIPYISIFFITLKTSRHFDVFVYGLFNVAYLLYFIMAHQTSYVDLYFLDTPMTWLKQTSSLFKNGTFTLLIATLVWLVYSMYRSGVASNSFYRSRPFTIGISGDSGSGKSTLTNIIRSIVGAQNVLSIEGDGDHKWERGNAMWKHFTHLNPKSNYLYRQAKDMQVLRSGQSVNRVDYDHATGQFTSAEKISPKPYIVLCGLHSLYLPQVRNILDLKIYMDIDETLRRYWKIQRDTTKRGYSSENILEQIEQRIPDAEHYIYPQKKYADLLVTFYDSTLKDCLAQNHTERLSLKVSLDIAVDLEPLIQEVEDYGVSVHYDYDENLERQTIRFEGEDLCNETFPMSEIAEKLIPQADEIARLPLSKTDTFHGILELIILTLISHKMQGGTYNEI
jgi:uridine kinase